MKQLEKKTMIKTRLLLLVSVILLGFGSLKAQLWVPPSPPPVGKFPIYRLYNPYSGQHIISATAEKNYLSSVGWVVDGGLGLLGEDSTFGVPLYRFVRNANGDHYCSLISTPAAGYALEGVMGYVPTSGVTNYPWGPTIGPVAVYGFHPRRGTPDHLYSFNPNEISSSSNWNAEGVVFFVYLQ